MRDLERPPSSSSSASSDKYHVRMPGPTPERPRAQRLNDIEQHTAKVLGCGRTEDFGTPVSSGSNMGSVARFPKLDECAHFHYEHVELGALEVSVSEVPNDTGFAVRVTSGDACWTLQRSYDNFVMFDKQLHRCIFDRKFSSLTKLPDAQPPNACELLATYLERFSQLNHEGLNCGPVLNWLQLDNRGRRILVPESDSCPINTPAVAAAYAVRPYTAQAQDEISFQVGDMISVIDMPPPGESTWWRGKHGFAVGFFPAECVAVIGDKVPRHLTVSTTVRSRLPVKPVLRKHGKLIAFFRSFILNRPSRRRLKQSGILKERVFGCDLGEHLLNSGQDVPAVLTCCAEFIENHGLVDGIYRLSGVTSNIQRLRHAFDEDRVPALHSDEGILQDIHSVASLLKMYFRELPNPLCTYQLYSTFVGAVQANSDAERLRRMRDAVRKLPPPHYRTLEYLMRHLVRVAARGAETGMTPRNVAIVWAPNLLRCKELEVGGVAALQGVGVQAVVTEFLVCYAELIFGDGPVGRPKSLAITTPARLLSLEEARNRSLRCESDYIEVGAGPAGLPLHYHTVIELPARKRNSSKRSPSLNWRALFGRGGFGTRGKTRQVGTPPQIETMPNSLNSLRRLRPVKSADSLDGEDSIGPMLGPPPTRPCGHSRSVSHDSYFDHLADAPTTASPLDLSEIQLNFDLEEREMRMFSEEESVGGVASIEASPRRQRNDEEPPCIAVNGASKRKRSRLEERLHCDVELRFIDSQSPDQVMVSADIHGMETPSPLPTPGYLPLLSEASTPLTPVTMQGTPVSVSPGPTNSPRISFRSFALPLDLDESPGSNDDTKPIDNNDSTSVKSSRDPSQRSSDRSNDRTNVVNESRDNDNRDVNSSTRENDEFSNSQKNYRRIDENRSNFSDCSSLFVDRRSNDERDVAITDLNSDDRRSVEPSKKYSNVDITLDSRNDEIPGTSSVPITSERSIVRSSSTTDLDSPMSCEHNIDDLPDSGFVICDGSERMLTTTTTIQSPATMTNDSDDWVIIERTTESITKPISEIVSPKNDPGITETSLDVTMGSIVDTDLSCMAISDGADSSVKPRRENSTITLATNATESSDSTPEDDRDVATNVDENERKYGSDRRNGNERSRSNVVDDDDDDDDDRSPVDRDNDLCRYDRKIDNENVYRGNLNETEVSDGKCSFESDNMNDETTLDRIAEPKRRSENQRSHFIPDQMRSMIEKTSDNQQQRFDGTRGSHRHGFAQSPRKQQTHHNHHHHHHHQQQQQQQQQQQHHHHHHNQKYVPKKIQENVKRNNTQNTHIRDSDEVVMASESAAEPREIAHQPEGASETTSLNSSRTFTNPSSPIDDSVVLRDTAAILEELALQRLSGGVGSDAPLATTTSATTATTTTTTSDRRRSYDTETERDRGARIERENDGSRVRSEESGNNPMQYLPPCLRARHARSTRAALSRSLDEEKFNRMTGESSLTSNKNSDDGQHSSTPNVGTEISFSTIGINDKSQSRNLGGLDLGDPRCRERIEKYKEERRLFLRDKYRSESFRGNNSRNEDVGEQALLARLKQRASRPSLH